MYTNPASLAWRSGLNFVGICCGGGFKFSFLGPKRTSGQYLFLHLLPTDVFVCFSFLFVLFFICLCDWLVGSLVGWGCFCLFVLMGFLFCFLLLLFGFGFGVCLMFCCCCFGGWLLLCVGVCVCVCVRERERERESERERECVCVCVCVCGCGCGCVGV